MGLGGRREQEKEVMYAKGQKADTGKRATTGPSSALPLASKTLCCFKLISTRYNV